MAVINVTNSTSLSAALQSAKGGDTILMAGGSYGDFRIDHKAFATDVTIKSESLDNPAVFRTLTVNGSSNINVDGVFVKFTPDMNTLSHTSAVTINESTGISFLNGKIVGGPSVNGVPMSATQTDATSNIIGLAAGRGITINFGYDNVVENTDISQFHRGIVMYKAAKVVIDGNEIHDLRGSGIVGVGTQLTINDNNIHDINPWRWNLSGGDHADFIALWTDASQTTASTDIKITNNTLAQGDGTAVLGMWLQGKSVGYTNVTIAHNSILGGDFQGIMLEGVNGGAIEHNALLQTNGHYASPSILLLSTAKNIAVSNNAVWQIDDRSKGGNGHVLEGNTMVQHTDPEGANFYDFSLLKQIMGMTDADMIYGIIAKTLGMSDLGGALPPVTPIPPPVIVEPPMAIVPPPEAAVPPPVVVEPPPATPEAIPGVTLVGNWAANQLTGGAGNDTLEGGGGADTLSGGAGDDIYVVPNSLATIIEAPGAGIDTVIARGHHELAANVENLIISTTAANGWRGTGNELDNVIIGNVGGNGIQGLAGDDTIDGRAGNDIIEGGAGNDVLTGGDGADVFRFAPGSGQDVITDFGVGGRDTIDISGYLKAGIKPLVIEVGNDTVIKFSSGDAITLTGVDAHHLGANHAGFIFV